MRIDKIILGEISGDRELGVYAIAAMLAEAFYFIPMAVATALFPAVIAARESGDDFFHERLQKYYNLMVLLGYAVAVPTTLLAGWLIPLMYGQPFAKAGPMLIGLVWAGLFYNLTIVRGQYLTAMNWTRLHFVMDFLGCVANISLNFILIPRYGGMGAVIATIISYWLATHGLCFFYKPLHKTGIMMTRAIFYPKIW
jgi:O-antigen/teichoic acid export membrane protein